MKKKKKSLYKLIPVHIAEKDHAMFGLLIDGKIGRIDGWTYYKKKRRGKNEKADSRPVSGLARCPRLGD